MAFAILTSLSWGQFQTPFVPDADTQMVKTIGMPPATNAFIAGFPVIIGFHEAHDFGVGDIVDVHHGVDGIFRGLTIRTASENFIDFETTPPALEDPEGDPLPLSILTPVRVSPQVRTSTSIDPEDVNTIQVNASRVSYVDFRDVGGSRHVEKIPAGGGGWMTLSPAALAAVLAGGTVVELRVSNGATTFGNCYVSFQLD